MKESSGRTRKLLARVSVLFFASLTVSPQVQPAEAKFPVARIGQSNLIKLEVAQTPDQIMRGLMFRTSMPEDAGMVFLFHPPQTVNFWMYHTLMPLDMLFIKDGKIIKLFQAVPPCKSENPSDCAHYPDGPGLEVSEVIEVNSGYAQRHGVKEGDQVSFELP